MNFSLEKSISILENTPSVLKTLLSDLDAGWTMSNLGSDSWSPYDIVGHFIHGEKTDWIPRLEIMLSERADKTFIPFDRFAQFENSKGKTLDDLLTEFEVLRKENIQTLCSKNLTQSDLKGIGNHPELGEVTIGNLLSTWVVHDLAHLAQIARTMARQYREEVGPWKAYMSILK